MTPKSVLILLAAALGGCATASSKSLPVCDGQHRRPANPYGSVLDANPVANQATPAPPAPTPPGCGS